MNPSVPQGAAHTLASAWPVLQAPHHWRSIDFISDVHLQASQEATLRGWQDFMQRTRADAVFILGDLFDVWLGDDVIAPTPQDTAPAPGFETHCAQVLQAASQRLDLFLLHGNRDFLLGGAFARTCGLTLLQDPSVLEFAGQRWLLSHGDALCLDDADYLQFRSMVRAAPWQQEFLARPLAQRRQIAGALRAQSEARKQSSVPCADLDEPACCRWLQAAQASTLIHGHTHRPGDLSLPDGRRRLVLSDWDLGATPARASVLRLSVSPAPSLGASVQRLPAALF